MTRSAAPVIFLMGPTASGKTALAVELVQRFPLEIVSVDSAMVYRHLDIGTGKPSAEVLAVAPHRLIDIRDPDVPYSAANFRTDALAEIAAIQARGRIPLLVGGTGLYFRALRRGLARLPAADPAVRARLCDQAAQLGWTALHTRLARVDPDAARRIHPHDSQRIQRALEVHELTGQPMSAWIRGARPRALRNPSHTLVVTPSDRAALHAAIAERFDAMLVSGLVDEVERLRRRWRLDAAHPSMRAVGYRQVWQYLEGALDYPAMVTRALAATRQLARRQLTWLRAEPNALGFDSGLKSVIERLDEYLEPVCRLAGSGRGRG